MGPTTHTMARSRSRSRAPTQRRSVSTVPQTHAAHPPATASRQPGLFGQMASTAAGVAVGSTIGHTLGAGITSMFGGSSSEAAPAPVEEPTTCSMELKSFSKCMDEHSGDLTTCGWYLEQLKACKAAVNSFT